uniref:Flagellar biosynthesis protein FlhB n=1 Tax=Gloeothece verrucosa (strain PCC 7822) TaxID=497965 RepID=E0UNQ9_GLOV7|nr:flagellar biosynthesis protein FlhB [Gloeothece verrucosa PCC 7822]
MIDQLPNLDIWLSRNFPSYALDQLLTPSIFTLIILIIVIIVNNNWDFQVKNYHSPNLGEIFLLFGLGVIGVFLINFRWGG